MQPYLATAILKCLLLDCNIWLCFNDPVPQAQFKGHAVGYAPQLGRLVPCEAAGPDG